MISNLGSSAEAFLDGLGRIQDRLEEAQRQVTSGLKVARPSDAPDQVATILQLRAQLSRNEQISQNLDGAKSESDSADQAIQSAILVVERALALGGQGASDLTTQEQRSTLAEEMRGLHEQLVSLSLTAAGGRYIFGGDQDQSPPYALDPAGTTNGVTRLTTTPSTRQVEDTSGTTFAVAKTAQEIFDARDAVDPSVLRPDNVFAAVNELRAALESGVASDITAAMDKLHQASDHLNEQLGFYGRTQNRIDAAQDAAARNKVQLTTELSQRQDADITQAILELNQEQFHQTAALSARAQMPQGSLFDYLR